MTDKKRYERAMRQDYPKDFIPDDEWDFIDSMAVAKGDGIKNKSTTACRMPKSGGEKTMAKQQNDGQYTVQQKCDYYAKRASNPKLTEQQRQFAQRRLNSLCGGGSVKGQSPKAVHKSALPATAQQNNARNAGIGYGAAKAGARVPVAPENQQSFRNGVKVGRSLGKRF